MLTKLLAIATALSLAACVADDPTVDPRITIETAPPQEEAGVQAKVSPDMGMGGEERSLCELLPTDPADPCSHLCDPEGIDDYIPAHACVDLVCHLTDGTIFRAGGCAP